MTKDLDNNCFDNYYPCEAPMTSIKENCIALKNFFTDPEKWTKGAAARDKLGREVERQSQSAVSFCLIGAINKLNLTFPNLIVLTSHICKNIPDIFVPRLDCIHIYNDDKETTFDDLQKLLDKCIETA